MPNQEDKKNITGEILSGLGKTVKNAAVWGASQASQGIGTLYSTVKKDTDKYQKIKEYADYCKETQSWINLEQERHEKEMSRQLLQFQDLYQKVRGRIQAAAQYLICYSTNAEHLQLQYGKNIDQIREDIQLGEFDVAAVSLKSGGIAGAAAGGGAVALMTALGTASTGTALSSLSGAAFTHALLASFGGGSLAAGGLGMVGGAVVLGSIVVLPAVAVGGFVMDKKINKAYEKALDCYEKAGKARDDATAFFNEYDHDIETMKILVDRFRKFYSDFYDRIVDDMLMMAVKPSLRGKYDPVLMKATEIGAGFMNLDICSDNQRLNKQLRPQINKLVKDSNACYHETVEIFQSLSEKEKAIRQCLPGVEAENMNTTFESTAVKFGNMEYYQSVIQNLRDENQQLYEENTAIKAENMMSKEKIENLSAVIARQDKTVQMLESQNDEQNVPLRDKKIREYFDKALNESRVELDIISPWMTQYIVNDRMIEKFERLLQRGVTIRIIYGIKDHYAYGPKDVAPKTKETAQLLENRLSKYPNFKMRKADTHAKLFLCDEKYYVLSSFNILSYDGKGTRSELGEVSHNVTILRRYRSRYFQF